MPPGAWMKDRHREMTRKMREGATRPAVSDPQECRGLHTPAHRAHPPPLWPPALPRGSPTPATGGSQDGSEPLGGTVCPEGPQPPWASPDLSSLKHHQAVLCPSTLGKRWLPLTLLPLRGAESLVQSLTSVHTIITNKCIPRPAMARYQEKTGGGCPPG